MTPIVKTLVDLQAIMVLILMLRYVFGAEMKWNLKHLAIATGIYIVVSFICNQFVGGWSGFICVILFIAAVFVFSCRQRWKIIFIMIPLLLLYNMGTFYMRLVVDVFFGVPLNYEMADLFSIVVLLVWAVYVEKKQLKFKLNFWECLFLAIYSYMSNFYIEVSEMIALGVLEEKKENSYQMSWVFFVTIMNAAVFGFIVFRKTHAYHKQISRMYKQYFDLEYRAFQEKSDRQRELDRMRHDWKNHINTVQAMWEKGEANQAVEYVAGLAGENKANTYTLLSGNEVADAILNLKYEKAKEMGIAFSFEGSLAKLSALEPVDISVLLGNALDNALEACGKGQQESNISVIATENADILLLTIKNTLHTPIVLRDNRPVTSKKHPSEHGFGVLGMEHVARKYRGDLRFEIIDGIFKVQVMLPVGEV